MEILLWLLPAAVATCVAMLWVAWWGREGRGEIDREEAARRLGAALSREQRSRPRYAAPHREDDPISGVAVRPSRVRPVVLPPTVVEPSATTPATAIPVDPPAAVDDEQPTRDRRAS